jgi:hypothetical protein
MERVFGIVAAGALATSLAAIIIEQSAIVIVAGVLSCVMGTLVVIVIVSDAAVVAFSHSTFLLYTLH